MVNHVISFTGRNVNKGTAFILYRQHQQASVVRKYPGLPNPDISKIIGEQWSKLPDEQKNGWKALAEVITQTITFTHHKEHCLTTIDRKKRLVTRNNILIIVTNLVATVVIVLDLLVKVVVNHLLGLKSIHRAIASSAVARL